MEIESIGNPYTVVVVDDEPMAVKAICRLIEKHCPKFQVVGTAGNGSEAVSVIEETVPDLVLTDIAMPLMDGLEMIRTVKKQFKDMQFVIISGYQDFGYVRDAIREGVLDYLTKPIAPSQMLPTMERVEEELRKFYYARRNQLLKRLCSEEMVPAEEISRFFAFRNFHAALIRQNGLPRRLSGSGKTEIYGMIDEGYSVYGRDSMEELFLIPSDMLSGQTVLEYMQKIVRRRKIRDSYVTLLYYEKDFPVSQVPSKIKGLYRWLNACSTVGLSQEINLDDRESLEGKELLYQGNEFQELIDRLDKYAKTGRTEQMKQEFANLFRKWEEEQKPQLWVEHACRRILNYTRMKSGDEDSLLESEYQMEEAFHYSTSMTDLMQNLHDLLFRFREEEQKKPKVDSPEFFRNVEEYLHRHLAEQISLSQLSEEFLISQAYMSKLFRKYSHQTYNQYFTAIRMEEAKRLMKENETFYVKDIAECVGYHDQFYFSRLFRGYTGKSPADYLAAVS